MTPKTVMLEIAGNFLDQFFWLRHGRTKRIPKWCRHVLFSKRDDWEPFIRADFKPFHHVTLEFEKMSEEAVERADFVVPYELSDLLWLSDRPSLTKNKPIPIPARRVVDLCHNKRLLNSTLVDLGFESLIPSTSVPLVPPYILKPNTGENSIGTFIVTSFDSEIRNSHLLADSENIKQQLIPGEYEYATHMAVRAGELLAELTIEYRFDTTLPIKGKSKRIWKRATSCPDVGKLLDVLRAIEFEGICCFNYKMVEGKIMLIELNPRFGGSLSPHFTYLLSQMR